MEILIFELSGIPAFDFFMSLVLNVSIIIFVPTLIITALSKS